jgi:hypothetical protein
VPDDVKDSSLRPMPENPQCHPLIEVDFKNGIRLFQPTLATDPPGHLPLALPQIRLHGSDNATALGVRDESRDARHLRQEMNISLRVYECMISTANTASRPVDNFVPKALHIGRRIASLPNLWNPVEGRG